MRHGLAKMRTALASICLSLLVALSGALAGGEVGRLELIQFVGQ